VNVEVKEDPLDQEFKTIEEVRLFLLERGLDVARLPNPMRYIEGSRRDTRDL
jgi:hypothetical protein